MEKTKRNLKVCSFVAIVVGIISALRLVLACIWGNDMLRQTVEQAIAETNESMELVSTMMTIAYIILGISAAVTLLLNLYVGICGLGIAKGTYKGKAFMFWLIVTIILSILSIISNLTSDGDMVTVISSVIAPVILLCNHIEMLICARKIRSAS